MRVPSRTYAAAAFAILALSACGGSSSTPSVVATLTAAPTATLSAPPSLSPVPTPALPTPVQNDRGAGWCRVLTAAEIDAVTGGSYGEGVPDAVGGCIWHDGADFINAEGIDHTLAEAKSVYPGGVDLTVSGHACYFAEPGSVQGIWVEIPGGLLAITFTPFPDAVAQGHAEQLAATAIAHI